MSFFGFGRIKTLPSSTLASNQSELNASVEGQLQTKPMNTAFYSREETEQNVEFPPKRRNTTQDISDRAPNESSSSSRSSIASRVSGFFLRRTRTDQPSLPAQQQMNLSNQRQASDLEISDALQKFTTITALRGYAVKSPPTSCLEKTIVIQPLKGSAKNKFTAIKSLREIEATRLQMEPDCKTPPFVTLRKAITFFESGSEEPLTIHEVTRATATHLPDAPRNSAAPELSVTINPASRI